MPRRARPNIVGIPQLVVLQGHNGQVVFNDPEDYQTFMTCLEDGVESSGCQLHAFSLLTDRVVLLCTPRAENGVACLTQSASRRFVPYYNARYQRSGALWNGRYRSALVEPCGYVLTVYRYIDGLRRLVASADEPDPRWDSFAHHIGEQRCRFITDHGMYACLSERDSALRAARYKQLCATPLSGEQRREIEFVVLHGLVLGRDGFKDDLAKSFGVKIALGKPGRPAMRRLPAMTETGRLIEYPAL